MIVVDVNVLAYLWIPGDLTPLAEKTLRRDLMWVSSILWRSEFRNILVGYLRRGTLTPAGVDRCLDGVESQMAGRDYVLPSARVMRLVERSTCSAYDCEYVALAEDMGVRLVTSDRQILTDFPDLTVSLKDFSDGR